MALVLNGSGHLRRLSGLISNLNSFTFLLAVKRTATQTGVRHVWAIRPTDDTTDHAVYINDPNPIHGTEVIFSANFGDVIGSVDKSLPLNQWQWLAWVGNGNDVTFYYLDGTTWLSTTVPQVLFTPTKMYIGDGGGTTNRLISKYAAIREWNTPLSLAQIGQEVVSSTPVNTTGLLSAKSGVGDDLAAVLAGQSGVSFEAIGTVSIDSDVPTFSTAIALGVSQTLSGFTQTAILSGSALDAEANQTLEDFSQSFTSAGVLQFTFTVDLVPSSVFQFSVDLVGLLETEQQLEDFSQSVEVSTLASIGHFFVNQQLGDFDGDSVLVAQVSNQAPTVFTYTAVTCGPGQYGAPVNSANRVLKREIDRPWPTR